MRASISLAAIAITSLAGPVFAAPPAPTDDLQCTFRHPISEVALIEAVPAKIQFAILRRMDSSAREDAKFEWHHVMARRDENFTSTDVVTGDYPLRRFIRAGHVGNEWFVWFERGGIAYSKNIALFHLRLGRGVPIVRAFVSYATQNPCTVTDDLLDGSTRSDLGTGQW